MVDYLSSTVEQHDYASNCVTCRSGQVQEASLNVVGQEVCTEVEVLLLTQEQSVVRESGRSDDRVPGVLSHQAIVQELCQVVNQQSAPEQYQLLAYVHIKIAICSKP